ncbi:VOC family protein [Halalkalicoccus sp. NIPERK01]|uniref:VOC family protein n=1 Tax=Halalkalicoccus sp. NIPERK01 TaxID=3053469 RepID=UPI00256F5A0C|nr:VOC family protein [Halalkalicoccus sp. NIPERK01]MDL5360687.1 VOC family protein [Halalkalicoccus sp. NIPERK01]
MPDEPTPVTDELPDSPIRLSGTDHVTLIGSNEADTVAFYRDLLGMPLVLRQPNLDQPEVTHLFFDTGDGRILTFFVSDDRESDPRPQRTGLGAVHHLAFSVEPERFVETKEAFDEADHHYNEFDRGAFHSIYTRDHNGLVLEFATDKFHIPDDRRAEVLATAQRVREEAGADYVKDEHMEAALEELGLEVDPYDLPDAPTGAGYDR